MDQRFKVMIVALKNKTQDKRKYRKEEHAAEQTCRKKARTLVESPKEQQQLMISDDK